MSKPLGRREFLQGLGAAGAASLAGCSDYPGPVVVDPVPDGWVRGEERWVTTSCGRCPAACGIKVRVREGVAIKVEGNAGHPINQGGVGPKGQSGLSLLYHPDRIRGPLERRGPRGAGEWRPVTWSDAITAIGKRLAEIRAEGKSHEVVVLDGEPRRTESQLWRRFLDAYGSPNHVVLASPSDDAQALALGFMTGASDLPAYDWPNTRYVLAFGAGLFESWCQTIHLVRATSDRRRGAPGQNQKLVQISPRFSRTGAKADEWIAIAPGTHGMLALGLAHVLIQDKLYDEAFVRDHCFGFDDWKDAQGTSHPGFRTLVLGSYAPDKVAKVTGVPEPTIQRIAQELTEIRPAIAVADAEATAASNGLGTAMAIHALNALLGSLERKGGMLMQRAVPLAPWAAPSPDETAQKGGMMPRIDGAGTPECPLGRGSARLATQSLATSAPYSVSALVFSGCNPMYSSPTPDRWREATARVPLVVSLATLPDESTLWADYVLPTSTYLEQWDIVEPPPATGYPVLSLRQPAVAPVHDTLAGGDLVLRLAKAVGGSVAAAFPWPDVKKALEDRLQGIVDADRGSVTESDVESLVGKLGKTGGWWDPAYQFEAWDRAFRTPSGKFEFFSQEIGARLDARFSNGGLAERFGGEAKRDSLCLPGWQPLREVGDPAEYPFLLEAYRGIENADDGQRQFAVLRELPSLGRWAWRDRVELNPADARKLGIEDGDTVWIESPSASRRVCAILVPGVRPQTVALPLGGGAWPPAPGAETSTYSLLADLDDPLVGTQSLQETRVRVRKDGV